MKIREFFNRSAAPGPTGSVEFIVAGLGNPGARYDQTRHNAGFIAVDYIAKELSAQVKRLRFKALCGDAMLGGKRVLLMKPDTFMNLSGQAVTEAMAFYKIPPQRTLILLDDYTLPVGGLRVRRSGSDGGQKGMRNILYLSGSDTFPRIRIGIGQKPHPEMDLADWVLTRFTKDDLKQLDSILPNIMDAAQTIVRGDIDAAMQKYNVRGQGKQEPKDSGKE